MDEGFFSRFCFFNRSEHPFRAGVIALPSGYSSGVFPEDNNYFIVFFVLNMAFREIYYFCVGTYIQGKIPVAY